MPSNSNKSNSNNQKNSNQDARLGANGSSQDYMHTEPYIEQQIGEYLRQAYEDTVSEPIPDELMRVLDNLK